MPRFGNVRRLPILGTPTNFNKTATGEIVAPGSGKKLRLLLFFYSSDADIVTSLRWTQTGEDMFPLQQKGAAGMNLLGRKCEGGVDEGLFAYLSGSGTMMGTVITVEV